MINRVHNFSAGPSALPIEVLQKAQRELLNWNNQGASVMEISHRGKAFTKLYETLLMQVKKLLKVPDNYHILFMHGGANGQFFGVPMNLLGINKCANYVVTGYWSDLAYNEATKYGQIHLALNHSNKYKFQLENTNQWSINNKAAYTYIASNETLVGFQFQQFPTLNQPLVVDMTSDLLARQVDVSNCGIIFAGTQKNMGIAGLCLVIVRDDLINQAQEITPKIMHYKTQVNKNSFANTIPTYAVYMTHLVCEWTEQQGGVETMEKYNWDKANCLYNLIDNNPLYVNYIAKENRSNCNVSFRLSDPNLEPIFLLEAEKNNLIGLKGHQAIGGIRASIYNGVSKESVDHLAEFMLNFSHRYQ